MADCVVVAAGPAGLAASAALTARGIDHLGFPIDAATVADSVAAALGASTHLRTDARASLVRHIS